jgi:hypothetical protein
MMSYVGTILHSPVPSVADLLGSIASQLGLEGTDRVGLPPARRYVLVLVDALGWELAWKAGPSAPYLAGLIGDAVKVSAVLPTTTAASLMSLWTGVNPGQHGILGFSFRAAPSDQEITLPLFVETPLPSAESKLDWLVDQGLDISCVVPQEHIGSGLTLMSTHSAQMIGANDDVQARLEAIVATTRRAGGGFTYVYEKSLDAVGHRCGVASRSWWKTLTAIDQFLEQLRQGLDEDVCLLVTGDHGMINVAKEDRVLIDDHPALVSDLKLVGGEARFRHLYTDSPEAVAARWREHLGDEVQVWTREEAIDLGMFGLVNEIYRERIGDVVAVPRWGQAYLSSAFPAEANLVGMHGGMTAAERFVPVLFD